MSELSQDEMRRRFLEKVKEILDYYASLPATESGFVPTPECPTYLHYQLRGVGFSFLSLLDGCQLDMPAFQLVPRPHPSDKPYKEDRGEDWWPDKHLPSQVKTVAGNLALHELWHAFLRGEILQPVPTSIVGEGPTRIEVYMNESSPFVIAPVDDPARVEDALPPDWCVGHSWANSSPRDRLPDGRWKLLLWRKEDFVQSFWLGNRPGSKLEVESR